MKEIYKYITVIRLLLLIGVVGVLVLAAQQPAMTASCANGQCQAAAALPPRPTPSPTPVPTPQPTSTPSKPATETTPQQAMSGGVIQLEVSFAPEWPWEQVHWQTLWTIVQWQDHKRHWQDVKGWQGTLDELVNAHETSSPSHRIPLKQPSNSDRVVSLRSPQGYKSWWVAPGDLGRGPFRWAIYKSEGGTLLHTSEPFNLPATSGERLTIEAPIKW